MRDEAGFDVWADGYDEAVRRSDEADSYPFAGDISFQTAQERDAVRIQSGEEWDDAEDYIAWADFSQNIAVLCSYEQISPCAGTLTLRKPCMILFDIGETLADFGEYNVVAGGKALLDCVAANPAGITAEELGAFETEQFHALDTVRQDLQVEVHEHMLLRFVLEYFGLDLSVSMDEAEWRLIRHAIHIKPTVGIERLLGCLKGQGVRTAVISNIMCSGQGLRRLIESVLPDHAFEFILATSEYIHRKPSRFIFELALRKAGLPAADVWYCGDNPVCDVNGAAGVGITPIWYTRDAGGRDQYSPCTPIADWGQLTAWLGCSTINGDLS